MKNGKVVINKVKELTANIDEMEIVMKQTRDKKDLACAVISLTNPPLSFGLWPSHILVHFYLIKLFI